MEAKQILFAGYQGKITGVIENPLKQPLIELDAQHLSGTFSISALEELSLEKIRNYFILVYQLWGRYGFMGDVIAVKMVKMNQNYFYFLDFIGRLAFHKPGLAVDLLMMIHTKTGDYFIGIKRRYNPGQGKLALPGGFIDVNGYHLNTPVETVIQEAKEEINLTIRVVNPEDLQDYSPFKVDVEVDYNGQEFDGQLLPLGIVPTGDNEQMPLVGLKRVYYTTAFALTLDMSSLDLTEADINNWLKAGDDAADLVVVKLDDVSGGLEFGLSHHQLIFDALLHNRIMYGHACKIY